MSSRITHLPLFWQAKQPWQKRSSFPRRLISSTSQPLSAAPLAQRDAIRIDDLIGLPLFTSEQGWEGDIRAWAGDRFGELHLEGSFRLAYNASMFVREGLGYQLSFRHLVDVSPESGLTFRPLFPALKTKLYLIWNRYQSFTPIAERFIAQVRRDFQQM